MAIRRRLGGFFFYLFSVHSFEGHAHDRRRAEKKERNDEIKELLMTPKKKTEPNVMQHAIN